MHEATLAAHMIDIACDASSRQGGRVVTVTVVIGALAGIMADALAFAFDALKGETPLRHAVLRIETQPVVALCRDCGEEYAPSGFPYSCPACGSRAFTIVKGEDFFVKELEVRYDKD